MSPVESPVSVTHLEHRAFTSEKVRALTGLSARQLQYWDEQRFLSPSLRRKGGKGRRRLYDFRDLVSLRVAADLRRAGVSLQLIRAAVKHLRELDYRHPLSELRFWQVGGRLYFEEAGTVREARQPGQTIAGFAVPLREILSELEQGLVKLDSRPQGKVERRRGALGSKPLIAGTRIPVVSIQRLSADGADQREILRLYPDLSPADVRAALAEEPQLRRKSRAS
jgi:DNA-binding transcriptional MerR regulator